MTTSEILRQAAVEVRKGWCRYVLEDDDRNVCANGALARICFGCATEALNVKHRNYIHFRAAQGVIGEVLGLGDAPAFAIPVWNNATRQTQENVATTLEYAAMLWDQQQAAVLAETPEGEPA